MGIDGIEFNFFGGYQDDIHDRGISKQQIKSYFIKVNYHLVI